MVDERQPLARSLICLASFSICWAFFTTDIERVDVESVLSTWSLSSETIEFGHVRPDLLLILSIDSLLVRAGGLRAVQAREGNWDWVRWVRDEAEALAAHPELAMLQEQEEV